MKENIFAAGLETLWSLLCLFSGNAMNAWFIHGGPEIYRRYVRAVVRHWDVLDARGARYTQGSNQGEGLWAVAYPFKVTLAHLGVPHDLLRQPLPEIGGPYALLARADPTRAGGLVALGQAKAASWRARPPDAPVTRDDGGHAGHSGIPDNILVSAEMSAAMHADDPVAVRRLIEAGEPVDRSDLDLLRSPLLWAAEGGYADLVAIVLERGANIEDWADEGESPLMLAARRGHRDTVRLLVERGADLTYVTDQGWDAGDYARLGGYEDLAAMIEHAQSRSSRQGGGVVMGKDKQRHDPEPDVESYWLDDLRQAIETREDFVVFVQSLREYLQEHGASWKNIDLDAYLEALAAYTDRLGSIYDMASSTLPEQPTWKLVADLLSVARFFSPPKLGT